MDELKTYHPYSENHMAFTTEDLDQYVNAFDVHDVVCLRDASGKSMEQLQIEWKQSMGDLKTYHPYFGNHIALSTEDLDYYINAFDADSVADIRDASEKPMVQIETESTQSIGDLETYDPHFEDHMGRIW